MSDEHQKTINAAPRRGRPRAADPTTPVTIHLPRTLAARIDQLSRRNGRSTSDVVRRCVILQLHKVDE